MSGKLSQEHFTPKRLPWGVTGESGESYMLFILLQRLKKTLDPCRFLRKPFVKLKGNLGPVEFEKVFQNNNKPLISPAHIHLSTAKRF